MLYYKVLLSGNGLVNVFSLNEIRIEKGLPLVTLFCRVKKLDGPCWVVYSILRKCHLAIGSDIKVVVWMQFEYRRGISRDKEFVIANKML